MSVDRRLTEPEWTEVHLRFLFERLEKRLGDSPRENLDPRSDTFLTHLYSLTSLGAFLTRVMRGFCIQRSWIEGFSAADAALVGVLLKNEIITLEESRLLKQVVEFQQLPARALSQIDVRGAFEIELHLKTCRTVLERLGAFSSTTS